jgi:hypothetical protein
MFLLVHLVLLQDCHRRRACFGDAFNGAQFFSDKVQGVIVAVGFEKYREVLLSEEAVRGFNHHAFHRFVGHL